MNRNLKMPRCFGNSLPVAVLIAGMAIILSGCGKDDSAASPAPAPSRPATTAAPTTAPTGNNGGMREIKPGMAGVPK